MLRRIKILLILLLPTILNAQTCISNGGDLQDDTIIQCYNNQFDFVLSNEILDVNDQVFYCIFSDTGIVSSNLVAFSSTPTISNLQSALPNCGLFYAVCLVGTPNSFGGTVNFNNPCLSASNRVRFMHDKDPFNAGTWSTSGNPTDCINEYSIC